MYRKLAAAVATLVAACPSWAFQVEAFHDSAGAQLAESDGRQIVTVRVTRDSGDSGDCQIDVTAAGQAFSNPPSDAATPNVDFTPTTVNLSFPMLNADILAEQTFEVPVIDDALVESTEFFAASIVDATLVTLGDCDASDPIFGGENFVPIDDDDVGALAVSVAQPALLVDEGAGSVGLTVTLTGAETIQGDFTVTVDYVLNDGSAVFGADYGNGAASGTLFFGPGNLSETVTVPIVDDAEGEPGETFDLTLRNPQAALFDESPLQVTLGAATTTVSIADDDSGQAAFTSPSYLVDENAGTATITLSRSGGATGSLSVDYATENGTATAGADYTAVSGTVTWADGDTVDKSFEVPVIDDGEAEDVESLTLVIVDTLGQSQEAMLAISDDDQAAVAFVTGAVTAAESDGSVVLTLVRGGSTNGEVSVDFATEDGSALSGEDYQAAAGTVVWADGDGADKTVSIDLIEDDEDEETEDFTVTLSNVTGFAILGANSSVTVTVDASDQSRDISEIPTLTPNQRSLAGGLEGICARLAELPELDAAQQDLAELCALLRSTDLDDATVADALDAINPEELLVTTANALRLSAVQHGNLSQRLNALRSGATGIDLTGFNLEVQGQQIGGNVLQEMFDRLTGGAASADEIGQGRWGAFLNGRIATGDKDDTDNEAGFDFDLYAVTVGVDYRIRRNLIVGISAGMGSVESTYDDDGGELDIDSWNAGAYLTWFKDDSFYFDALATYGSNDYDSTRHIVFGSGPLQVARTGRGETDGNQFSLGFGTGWDASRGAWTLGPHMGGYYLEVEVDGFVERGAGGLDLVIGDQTTRSITVNGGGHVSYAWSTRWGVLLPNARLDWVHEFENSNETLAFRFLNDPLADEPGTAPTITLESDRPDSNYFVWSLGVSAQFAYGLSGFVNYQSYAGYRDVTLQEWSFGARWQQAF